jgi:hypothetical protein
MKFGVRDICDVVFKAKAVQTIGTMTFQPGQPVLYIDSAKTSTMEGTAATVYATGGKGNARLIAWEGEKTLTFTVEDALLSPIGFAVLSGAGLLKGKTNEKVHVHSTSMAYCDANGDINLADVFEGTEVICDTAPIFIMVVDADGSLTGETITKESVNGAVISCGAANANKNVFVDFYVEKESAQVSELQIDMENFAGNYYVEASTLFRRQHDGVDLPAEITFPNVKIQSNFTFAMSATGDPSTFTFTMDALPGYTYFNKTKKVLCAIQIVEDVIKGASGNASVFPHADDETITLA